MRTDQCEWGTCESEATHEITVDHARGKGVEIESYCSECADMRIAELEDRGYTFDDQTGEWTANRD